MACEYCIDDNMLGVSEPGSNGVDVQIQGGDLVVSGWFDTCVGIEPLRIPIEVCPICAEKLGGDAS